jgi:hypothetical protein
MDPEEEVAVSWDKLIGRSFMEEAFMDARP